MANKNPKTDHFKASSPIEARKNGRKGGLKRAENERKRKTLRQYAEIFGSLSVKDDVKKKMAELGLDESVIDKDMQNIKALYDEAAKGNVAAFNAIRDIKGENPVNRHEVSGDILQKFQSVGKVLENDGIMPLSEDDIPE